MPIYDFICSSCDHYFDVYVKGFNFEDATLECENCGQKTCKRQISAPMIQIGADKPDRYSRKDSDQEKKSKDPERARRIRKKLVGTEGVSITKSPHYHKEKRVKAQGNSDVDKKTFIQQAAKNPNAVAAANKALGKSTV